MAGLQDICERPVILCKHMYAYFYDKMFCSFQNFNQVSELQKESHSPLDL